MCTGRRITPQERDPMPRNIFNEDGNLKRQIGSGLGAIAALAVFAGGLLWMCYAKFVIEVPAYHVGILVHKTGKDLANTDVVAPDDNYKGVQKEVLDVGRYFFRYDPYNWAWEIKKQVEIPDKKLGIRIRLYGDDLPYGEFLAHADAQKGIVPGVLLPGRYPINPYLYAVEQPDPQRVPAA